MTKHRREHSAPPWTNFQRATMPPEYRPAEGETTWLNSRYQVNARPFESPWGPMLHLSIKRRDKATIHDWRDLQRIKNAFVGPECEGVELFPAEERLVDTANQYHLWCLLDPEMRFPFGYGERLVSEDCGFGGKSVQRPFPEDAKPADLKSADELTAMAKAAGVLIDKEA